MTSSTARACAAVFLTAVVAALAAVAVSAQKTQRDQPFPAYYFEIVIEGQVYPFKSCSGLRIERDVVEFQEGAEPDVIRKLPGRTHYANIRLSRAFTGDRSLYNWFATMKRPDPSRINGEIIMRDRQGTRIAAWKFINGFPVKWEGPDFDASKNEVAVETLEIAHEGLIFADDGN